MKIKIKNLRDLKDYLNTLNEEQLDGEPFVNRNEEFTHAITGASQLEEDHYLNEEGLDAVSAFDPIDEEDSLDNYEVYPAGYVFFSADDVLEEEAEFQETTEEDPY